MTSVNMSPRVRVFATNHLRVLLRAGISGFRDWGIQLLATQLYDPSIEVCQTAVAILEEACNDRENLQSFAMLRPNLEHLEELGAALTLQVISTSAGFRYYSETQFVQPQMEYWYRAGNMQYVALVELRLHRTLTADVNVEIFAATAAERDKSFKENVRDFTHGGVAPHLYGCLARTEEGCQLLRTSGHVHEFVDVVRNTDQDALQSPMMFLQFKACLWALGHIGSSETGFPFIEESNVIPDLVRLAETADLFSLRGTCYYVLRLISDNIQGAEALEELGWPMVTHPSSHHPGEVVYSSVPPPSSRMFKVPDLAN